MPLPSSGTIKISEIRAEFGTSNGSLRYLSSLAGFSTPDRMSEFYGYGATCTISVYNYTYTVNQVSLYVNGGFYASPNGMPSTYTGITTGNCQIQMVNYDYTGGTIDYYLNGSYITTYSAGGSSISTPTISTSSGNTYTFYCYFGL